MSPVVQAGATTPSQWGVTLSGGPDLCSSTSGWNGALIRRWRGTSPSMEQPPLDHNYVALHLGGAKRVSRRGDGPARTANAGLGSITVVPAGTRFAWTTEGPIGFAHIYVTPAAVDRLVIEEFDREPRATDLIDCVGHDAPLLGALYRGLLDELERPSFAPRLALDTLLRGFMVRLLCECSTLPDNRSAARHALAPWRLRRAVDFVEANLGADIALADIAAVAGSSPFHFTRAFHIATGFPPYRYLVRRRIERARVLLREPLSVVEVATRCGFRSPRQFAAMFKRTLGVSPARYRRER